MQSWYVEQHLAMTQILDLFKAGKLSHTHRVSILLGPALGAAPANMNQKDHQITENVAVWQGWCEKKMTLSQFLDNFQANTFNKHPGGVKIKVSLFMGVTKPVTSHCGW